MALIRKSDDVKAKDILPHMGEQFELAKVSFQQKG